MGAALGASQVEEHARELRLVGLLALRVVEGRVAVGVLAIDVDALAVQEEVAGGDVAVGRSEVQRRAALVVLGVHVAAVLDEAVELGNAPFGARTAHVGGLVKGLAEDSVAREEQVAHLLAPRMHRVLERRNAVAVGDVDVRLEGEKELYILHVALRGGHVQRSALVRVHGVDLHLGIVAQDVAEVLEAIRRFGRGAQLLHRIGEHALGAMLEQEFGSVRVLLAERVLEGRASVPVFDVHLGAQTEEELDHMCVPLAGREVDGPAAVHVGVVDADARGADDAAGFLQLAVGAGRAELGEHQVLALVLDVPDHLLHVVQMRRDGTRRVRERVAQRRRRLGRRVHRRPADGVPRLLGPSRARRHGAIILPDGVVHDVVLVVGEGLEHLEVLAAFDDEHLALGASRGARVLEMANAEDERHLSERVPGPCCACRLGVGVGHLGLVGYLDHARPDDGQLFARLASAEEEGLLLDDALAHECGHAIHKAVGSILEQRRLAHDVAVHMHRDLDLHGHGQGEEHVHDAHG
mmetsp:Transcript_18860/g.55305  ORF Transcript_18860/g.55305 Transcript_18860/m.55305 type:complete len:523 (+) Transcript_18860:937-2505(+)